LPEAIRFIGKWSAKIKRIAANIQNDLDRELRLSELREQMQSELKRIQELEIKMQAQMDNIIVIHQPIIRNPEQHLLNYELT
ncbi:twin-arginine translocase subunit TatB, partial [Acinetobacter schindleri]